MDKAIFAIDPGPVQSAYAQWNGERVLSIGIIENIDMMPILRNYKDCGFDSIVIEQIECYGMPVGKSIFETVFWSGRFWEVCPVDCYRLPRKEVKMHLCQSMRAKDSNVIQALVDRFAPFEKNKGKGTKASPGFFHGFKKDIWQAFALACTFWDQNLSQIKEIEERERDTDNL